MNESLSRVVDVLVMSPILMVAVVEVIIVLLLVRELFILRRTPRNDPNRTFNVFNSIVLLIVGGVLFSVPGAVTRQVSALDEHIIRYPIVTSGTADALLWGHPEHWTLYTPDPEEKIVMFYEDLAKANGWGFLKQSDGSHMTLLVQPQGKRVFIVISQGRARLTEITYALTGIVQVTTATTTMPMVGNGQK